jgi:hypothetical protein
MEDTNTRGYDTATFERKVIQPRLIIQALAFTGILYFCVGQTPPEATKTRFPPVETRTTFSTTVGHSVIAHASQQSGLPAAGLRIVQVRPQTWSDNCLGLANSRGFCTPMAVPGWQIAVMSGQQRWIYRTNASGSVIKLEREIPSPSS